MHFLPFWTIKTIEVTDEATCKITLRYDVTSNKPYNLTSCPVLCNVMSGKPCDIIQLLTYVEVDMECY